jgi:uncharacterized coiled-coil DUF342 family protein
MDQMTTKAGEAARMMLDLAAEIERNHAAIKNGWEELARLEQILETLEARQKHPLRHPRLSRELV